MAISFYKVLSTGQIPCARNKSGYFTGQAKALHGRNFVALLSYSTVMAIIIDGQIYGLNQHYNMCYSNTSMKHLSLFLNAYANEGQKEAFKALGKTGRERYHNLPKFEGMLDFDFFC